MCTLTTMCVMRDEIVTHIYSVIFWTWCILALLYNYQH